mgnify:CR=1 FL=1
MLQQAKKNKNNGAHGHGHGPNDASLNSGPNANSSATAADEDDDDGAITEAGLSLPPLVLEQLTPSARASLEAHYNSILAKSTALVASTGGDKHTNVLARRKNGSKNGNNDLGAGLLAEVRLNNQFYRMYLNAYRSNLEMFVYMCNIRDFFVLVLDFI